MSFNGNEGEFISLDEASQMTARYRNTIQPGEVIGQFIGKDLIEKIINQDECVGIRIYFGVNENGKNSLVLVGADSNEDDLFQGKIADRGWDSPPHHGIANPLNS